MHFSPHTPLYLIISAKQGYDTSLSYEDNNYDAGYSEYSQGYFEDRHRGAGFQPNKKRLIPSEPSPHVIFLGLDTDFTEADVCTHFSLYLVIYCIDENFQLQAYLSSNSCSVESVTIIRDRSTGT